MSGLLLTGFLPFAGDSRNPSGEIAEVLDGAVVRGLQVAGAVLPVDRKRATEHVSALLAEHRPGAVVALGQGGSPVVHVERVAVNLLHFRIPDGAGEQPIGIRIDAAAADALQATLDVDALVSAVRSAGVPCAPSLSAGSYLCNMVFFQLLEAARASTREPHRAVFVHLPPLPDAVAAADNERPSMSLELSRRAVEAVLDATASALAG